MSTLSKVSVASSTKPAGPLCSHLQTFRRISPIGCLRVVRCMNGRLDISSQIERPLLISENTLPQSWPLASNWPGLQYCCPQVIWKFDDDHQPTLVVLHIHNLCIIAHDDLFTNRIKNWHVQMRLFASHCQRDNGNGNGGGQADSYSHENGVMLSPRLKVLKTSH